ncbi:hypothetical protein GF340_03575 [Candidatus Peregrinibacteria bacterium]|nr:hypothetical protein [Candidatus Peregrinibacteria bacterium]
MLFRRILAALLVIIFVVTSVTAFVAFAFSNTFLNVEFYRKELREPGYEFLVGATVKGIKNSDTSIGEYFNETDLRREIEDVFTMNIYDQIMDKFVSDMERLDDDPTKPLTLRLGIFRESLLTLANNLSYKIYENTRICLPEEEPEEKNGLPTCRPEDASFSQVAAPITRSFEKDIYAAVPEQIQFDLNSAIGDKNFILANVFSLFGTVKTIFYASLLLLLALISLVIYKPFTAIMSAQGIGFGLSGLIGLILGYILTMFGSLTKLGEINADMTINQMAFIENEHFVKLISNIFAFFGKEIMKGAAIFLAMGVLLLLVRLYLKRK